MYIEKISLTNFRNYEEESVFFEKDVNIISGKNGQGKTNLIEAVHILSLGKSFRTLTDADLIRFGEEFFHVKGDFVKDKQQLPIEIIYSKKEKKIVIGGAEKQKNADLLENAYTVVFSPEDLKIVSEDPERRRKFLDRELFQLKPLYYKEVVKYRKALTNRNFVLKEERCNDGLLDVYDTVLAESGARIIKERSAFTEKLCGISAELGAMISNGRENMKVAYENDLREVFERQIGSAGSADSKEIGRERIEEALLEKLRAGRKKDKERRTTTSGPHLDDLKITANGIDLRRYGSRGQQRTAALAMKLAELRIIKEETGEDAILLLDDVLSELDEERQRFLISAFAENQLIITAAGFDESVSGMLPAGKRFYVSGGKITEVNGRGGYDL